MRPGETMGHEGLGLVEGVGRDVKRFKPGDRVMVAFSSACGRCFCCLRGQTSLCERFANRGFGEFGGGLDGLQAEAARIPRADVNLLPMPGSVDDEWGLFVGDILTTGLYGATLASFQPGDWVAVVGAEPVGCSVAGGPHLTRGRRGRGARPAARPAGARGADPSDADRSERGRLEIVCSGVVRWARGRCSGRGRRIPRWLRDGCGRHVGGGSIVVLGVFGDETFQLDMGWYWNKGLTVAFSGICPVQARWGEAMQAVTSGQIDPTPIISHRLALDGGATRLRDLRTKEATKVLLRP